MHLGYSTTCYLLSFLGLADRLHWSIDAHDKVIGGVVRQCAKGGANKIRAPAPTVPGPRPARRPEHTNVAMDPAEVLRQAGVSVSEEFDLGPALPFTMGTAGSDSEFQDYASPTASASGLMGAFLG